MEQPFDYEAEARALLRDRCVWKKICRGVWQELRPEKKNLVGFFTPLFIGAIAAIYVATIEQTVSITEQICDMLLTAQLSIFACILTVYSIMLALMSDNYIKNMMRAQADSEKSYLKRSIGYFENVMYLYFIAIAVSLMFKLVLICISDHFRLTKSLLADEIIAGVLLAGYFVFSFRTIYEVKSIIGNTALLFRASIAYKMIEFQKQEMAPSDKDTSQ